MKCKNIFRIFGNSQASDQRAARAARGNQKPDGFGMPRCLSSLTATIRSMGMNIKNSITLPNAPTTARTIPLKSDSHFSGHLVVQTGGSNGTGWEREQVMEVESHLEMNLALILTMRPQVAELENQVLFKWWCPHKKALKCHFFDFRVNLADGSRVAVMVKDSRKLSCPKFCAEARSIATKVTPAFADDVVVMTEADVDPVEIHNATFLDSLKETDPEADAAARRAMRGRLGARSISDIVTDVGLPGRGFRAVGRLLRRGELALTKIERITPEALVCRACA